MKTEMSPQVRSLISGLTAMAAMTLLITTQVESFEPPPSVGTGEFSARALVAVYWTSAIPWDGPDAGRARIGAPGRS